MAELCPVTPKPGHTAGMPAAGVPEDVVPSADVPEDEVSSAGVPEDEVPAAGSPGPWALLAPFGPVPCDRAPSGAASL